MSFRIMSSPEGVDLGGGAFMQPFLRYVLPAGPSQACAVALQKKGVEPTMSVFNAYARPYGGADLNGKRLAFYRHAAFGDQLMATSAPVYLKHLYPGAQIDVYCSPEVKAIWRGLPVRTFSAPMTFEAARSYDWHLFYDQMIEEDREPDQANAYDSLFGFAGLRDAPDVFKRPKVVSMPEDGRELHALGAPGWPDKILVYQLGAANANRTYPPEQGGVFINRFLREFQNWAVVILGLDQSGENLRRLFSKVPELEKATRVINLVNRLRAFRSLIPLVQNAGLVVCPDSSIGHLAAAFPEVPVISLWGLFAPDDRAKYYPNHRPLWPQSICPHAPCHNHDFTLPQQLCRTAINATSGVQASCNVLRAIAPEVILAKAREILAATPAA